MHATFLEQAQLLDAADELAGFRNRFAPIEAGLIYLEGNSLGRLPLATRARMESTIEDEWGQRLIRSWNEGWLEAPQRVGGKIAGILGAAEDEVIVADSTSINLFKLAVAALLHQSPRTKIITDDLNFPSDLYILEQACALAGGGAYVEMVPSGDGIHAPLERLLEAIDEQTALVSLSHVAFKSGYLYDMATVCAAAQAAGALSLWDLSHSVGAVPIDLRSCSADLAVGCTYKYLNGGPGAPAFLFARQELQRTLHNPIPGWMGHRALFEFNPDYVPAPGLRRFLTGTPSILSLNAIETGVDLVCEAGMGRIREKSMHLGEFLLELWRTELEPLGFYLNSPAAAGQRGSHLAVGHLDGQRIDLALIAEMAVLPDFRAPDTIRWGLAPLYTTFAELVTAVERLQTVVMERRFEKYVPTQGAVT